MAQALLIAAFLMPNFTCIEALEDMTVCYILDGVLILYGVILTVLYCRLRMSSANKTPSNPPEKPAEGGIYAVRLLSLMIKKTIKKADEGKVTT
ncbi:high affinity immunoglobulin epsilon receptor subunit gamma-like isoform X3 [Plectropomus leopardus]|uniref:high affinity immunoglobulin epsilon receptor subunit gamma-like isoform X3 n=1 Tax=Plectropomus leopardus TaxID=160734 RepID=UPI001C4C8C72|nr:high affinity immunoglobulin epsilon receptor subunit gamma-like isoform X3 [Plectropomus leopardus]